MYRGLVSNGPRSNLRIHINKTGREPMNIRMRILFCIAMISTISTALAQTPAGKVPDAAGNVPAKAAAVRALLPPAGYPACVMFFNGGLQWKIDLQIDPNTYPFVIKSGTIIGNICGNKWTVTGGSMGNVLTLKGKLTPPVGGCATDITLTGNIMQPPSYKGKYGFPSQVFPFTGLFTGYHTCP
jgi:hypothetical protein